MKTCPKCGYERKPEDIAPDYECPQCGVIYQKFLDAQAPKKEEPVTPPPEKQQLESSEDQEEEKHKGAMQGAKELGFFGVIKKVVLSIGIAVGCIVAVAFSMPFLAGIYESFQEQEKPPAKAEVKKTRKEKIEDCFSGWDGSHKELTMLIKRRMNDPDSFKHIETRYIDRGEAYIVVTESFRGKNAFGGYVKNHVMAKTDAETCVVLEIIKQK